MQKKKKYQPKIYLHKITSTKHNKQTILPKTNSSYSYSFGAFLPPNNDFTIPNAPLAA